MNLIIHCGGRRVDRQKVEVCPVPPSTQTWMPIPHHRLLGEVERSLNGASLRILSQAHALSANGERYFGLLAVANGQAAKDYQLVVGLRNSHDKSFPAGLVVGSQVCVCDNLAFSGEVNIARRHTRFIVRDLPGLVDRAVGQLGELRGLQEQRIEAYRHKQLSDMRAHDLLVQAMTAGALPPTRLPLAVEEWQQPRHEAFRQNGRTAWRLFNAVTEAIKGQSLQALPRRTQTLHGLLDNTCGLHALGES